MTHQTETTEEKKGGINWDMVEIILLVILPALFGLALRIFYGEQLKWIPDGLLFTVPIGLALIAGALHKVIQHKDPLMILLLLLALAMWIWTGFMITPKEWDLWVRLLPGVVITILLVIGGVFLIRRMGWFKVKEKAHIRIENGKVTGIDRAVEDGQARVTSSRTTSNTRAQLGPLQVTYEDMMDQFRRFLDERTGNANAALLDAIDHHRQHGTLDPEKAKRAVEKKLRELRLLDDDDSTEEHGEERPVRRRREPQEEWWKPRQLREKKKRRK